MMEEEYIDRERIVDGDNVPAEYFCPICQYLLWKPRSCASCQHLFCGKCLRTWFENPNSGNKCPFRCEPFADRPCPPYLQSLLSHLNIRCRNSSFGCTVILSYDTLEYHENVQCEHPTQRCTECKQLVLRAELEQHRELPGLCQPCPIACTICQNHIEKFLFQEHFRQCCEKRIKTLKEISAFYNNTQRILTGQPATTNHGLNLFEDVANTIQLVEQQKRTSRLPTSLRGMDVVTRAREQNCGPFFHILIMLEFILLNWQKIPLFTYIFTLGGFIALGICVIEVYSRFFLWVYTHICLGSLLTVFLNYLLYYATEKCLQYFSDLTISFFVITILFLYICASRVSLEVVEMDALFNRPILCVMLSCVGLFLMKITLLLIRAYYWSMPLYLGAVLLTLVHFYLGYKAYVLRTRWLTTNTNQLRMPV